VDSLEPFDEFEEFHLKCSHYILLTAFIGPATRDLNNAIWAADANSYTFSSAMDVTNDNFHTVVCRQNGYLVKGCESVLTLPEVPLTCGLENNMSRLSMTCSLNSSVELNSGHTLETPVIPTADSCTLSAAAYSDNIKTDELRVIGHAATTVVLAGQTYAVITGGFGMSGNRHMRLDHITLVPPRRGFDVGSSQRAVDDSRVDEVTERFPVGVEKLLGAAYERMYHTATCVGGNKIILFGGRTSPVQCFGDSLVLEISSDDNRWQDIVDREETTHKVTIQGSPNGESSSGSRNIDASSRSNGSRNAKASSEPLNVEAFSGIHNVELSSGSYNIEASSGSCDRFKVTCRRIETPGGGPGARWRHSASFSAVPASPRLLIFGGRNLERCLGDCWSLDCLNMKWTEVCLFPIIVSST